MKRYRIYKASIHTYRVFDTIEEKIISPEEGYRYLSLEEPEFKVDPKKFAKASRSNFVNSNDPMDFFAWVETDSFSVGIDFVCATRIKFNPFKGSKFFTVDYNGQKDRDIDSALYLSVMGNELWGQV